MMSLETILYYEKQAALRSKVEELEPYTPASPEEPLRWNRVPIPNLGSYRPSGWQLVCAAFVDSSGVGYSWEPAMTQDVFARWVSSIVETDPTAGFAIISEGEFQVHVGYFTQDAPAPKTVWAEFGAAYPGESFPGHAEDDLHEDYCPNCGALVDADDFTYCEDCGYDPEEEVEQADPNQPPLFK